MMCCVLKGGEGVRRAGRGGRESEQSESGVCDKEYKQLKDVQEERGADTLFHGVDLANFDTGKRNIAEFLRMSWGNDE